MRKNLLLTFILALIVSSCQKESKSFPGSYSYNSTITISTALGTTEVYNGIGQMRIVTQHNSDTLSIIKASLSLLMTEKTHEFKAVVSGNMLKIVPYTDVYPTGLTNTNLEITGGDVIMRSDNLVQINEEFRTALGSTGTIVTYAERN